MRPDPKSFSLAMCRFIQTKIGLMGRLCLLLFLVSNLQISTQSLWAQTPLDSALRKAISPQSAESAGQVASVFESEPEWL